MKEFAPQPTYTAVPLTHELAEQYIDELTALANLIPEVEYTAQDILAENKGERKLLNKWQHSLVIIDNDKPIAFIMGYERESEGNEQYPENTLYISELAVTKSHQGQGIGRSLLEQFFVANNSIGFLSLSGELNYSVQTNLAYWNHRAISLYEFFGFKQRASKSYPNRTDIILGVKAEALQF